MGKQPLKKKEVSSPKDKLAALKAFKEANGLGGVKEKELHVQAGNSIVVDVLYHLFRVFYGCVLLRRYLSQSLVIF